MAQHVGMRLERQLGLDAWNEESTRRICDEVRRIAANIARLPELLLRANLKSDEDDRAISAAALLS